MALPRQSLRDFKQQNAAYARSRPFAADPEITARYFATPIAQAGSASKPGLVVTRVCKEPSGFIT